MCTLSRPRNCTADVDGDTCRYSGLRRGTRQRISCTLFAPEIWTNSMKKVLEQVFDHNGCKRKKLIIVVKLTHF